MNEKFEVFPETGERIVYVRPVDASELPDDVRAQVGETGTVYALHDSDGAPLALVRDRRMAYALARQNDMAPVPLQ